MKAVLCGDVDRIDLLNEFLFPIVQSNMASTDIREQRGNAVVKPFHCARLSAGAHG